MMKKQRGKHVLLAMSYYNDDKEIVNAWQEFSLPLQKHIVEEWCSLKDIWFHRILSINMYNLKDFENKKHFIDSNRVELEELENGNCYLVCGFWEQGMAPHPPYVPSALPKPSATQAILTETDPLKRSIKLFRVITKANEDNAAFFMESSNNELESALRMYYEMNGSSPIPRNSQPQQMVQMGGQFYLVNATMPKTGTLLSEYTSVSDFYTSPLSSRDLNFQLLVAAMQSELEKLEALLSLIFIDLHYKDQNDMTVLHHAAIQGNIGITKKLLENEKIKKLVNAKEKHYGYTPAHYAAGFGHPFALEALLENGADVKILDEEKFSPFHYAMTRNHPQCVKLIMTHAKKHNIKLDTNVSDSKSQSMLHKCIMKRSPEMMKILVENFDDVDFAAKDADGDTALHYAVIPTFVALDTSYLEIMLSKKLSKEVINAQNKRKWTALLSASNAGFFDCVKLLLENGADPNLADDDGNTPLLFAIMRDHIEVAKLLMDKGADMNAKGLYNKGISPIQLAASKGQTASIEELANRGVDLNVTSEFTLGFDGVSFTPLINAAIECKAEAIKTLIKKGANKQKPCEAFSRNALHYAAGKGRREVVEALLLEGVDVNHQDAFGQTPIFVTKETNNKEIYDLLVKYGADVSIRDISGVSAANYDPAYSKLRHIKQDMITNLKESKNDKKKKTKQTFKAVYNNERYTVTKFEVKGPQIATTIHKELEYYATYVPKVDGLQQLYGVSYFFGHANVLTVEEESEMFNLNQLISKNHIHPKIKIKMALHVACLLGILHNHKIAHKNLKPQSVKVKQNYDVALGDYGISHLIEQTYKNSVYTAPEVKQQGLSAATMAADVYSFGMLLCFIITEKPFVPQEEHQNITLRVDKNIPDELLGLFAQCIATEPFERPSMKDVFQRLCAVYSKTYSTVKIEEDKQSNMMMGMEAMTHNYMNQQFNAHETKVSTLEKLFSKHPYPYNPLDNINYISGSKDILQFFNFLTTKLATITSITDDERKALAESQTVLTKEYKEGEKPLLLSPTCYEHLGTIVKKMPQASVFGMIDVIRCIVLTPNLYYLTTQNANLLKVAFDTTKDDNVAWTTQWAVAKLLCNLCRDPDSVGFLLQHSYIHFALDLVVKCLLRTEAEKNKPLDEKPKLRLKEAAAALAYDICPYLPAYEDALGALLKKLCQTMQIALKTVDIKEREGRDACYRLLAAIHRMLMNNMDQVKELMKSLDISRFNAVVPATLYAALVAHCGQAQAAAAVVDNSTTTTTNAPSTPLATPYANAKSPFSQ